MPEASGHMRSYGAFVGNMLPNNAVNPPVRKSRRLQGKRRAFRPAGYRER
jgi:hypothetical protein